MIDEFPIEEPTDQAQRPARKMPGESGSSYGGGLYPREPAPHCPVRSIDDIDVKFRKPAKPPQKRP